MTPYRPPEALPQRAVHRLHPAVMLVAIASGFVMAMLDVTVVNVALSAMREPLHASLNSLVWVVGAYTLTFAAFLPPALVRPYLDFGRYGMTVLLVLLIALPLLSARTGFSLDIFEVLVQRPAEMVMNLLLTLVGRG